MKYNYRLKALKLATLLSISGALLLNATNGFTKEKYISVVNDHENESSDYFQGSPPKTENDVYAGFGYNFFDSFGVQFRYAKSVLKTGFLPGINDSVLVEAGTGLTFYGDRSNQSGVTGFSPIVTARWDLHFTEEWTFFGTLGFGFNFVSKVQNHKNVPGGGLFPAIGVGAMYSLTEEWGLRSDLGWQFFGLGGFYRF